MEETELLQSKLESLKQDMCHIKNEIRKANKPKTITITHKVHSKLKNYCSTFGFNMGDLVEKIILDEINCVIKDVTIDDLTADIMVKFIKDKIEESKLLLIKLDCLLLGSNFTFKCYSILDGKPIYSVGDIELERLRI